MVRIYQAEDEGQMSRQAANLISAQVILKPDAVLGLATGSSPIGPIGSWWSGIEREILISRK